MVRSDKKDALPLEYGQSYQETSAEKKKKKPTLSLRVRLSPRLLCDLDGVQCTFRRAATGKKTPKQ